MDVSSRIHIGYIYSLGNGLLRYDGAYESYPEKDKCVMCHRFTVVKPIRSFTRDVKPWEQYNATTSNGSKHGDCIFLYREAFKYMEYQPALTVLYGS